MERKNTPVDSKEYDAKNLYVETIKTIIPPAAPPINPPIVPPIVPPIASPIAPPLKTTSYIDAIKNKK